MFAVEAFELTVACWK